MKTRLRNPPKDIITQLKQCPALQEQGPIWTVSEEAFELMKRIIMEEMEKERWQHNPAQVDQPSTHRQR
jgi:hypothetical protein